LAEGLQELAFDDTLGSVEPKHSYGNLPHQCQGLDDGAIQFEMLSPYVSPGIEESDRAAGTVYGCDISPFVPIAEDTGIGKITNTRGTPVLPADDMVDLMRKTNTILVDQTIFTSPRCAFDYKAARCLIYLKSHC
jgi:hypothetical protein